MDANNVPMYLSSSSSNNSTTTNMNEQHSLNNGTSSYNNNNSLMHQTTTFNNNEHARTLYVGNLDPSITENFVRTLFSTYGQIIGLKLINDNLNDLYCFIEYGDHHSAATALQTMNKRQCLGREIKVNWASNSGGLTGGPKPDTSRHFHIFVGDLSSEIETQQLRDAFKIFGEISDCRVVRDPHTFKSKGYGFVSFIKKQDAESAIANMNGQWLGHRPIRTNWATRKMPMLRNDNNQSVIGPSVSNKPLNYEEVYNQSSVTNCTVYCGGIMNGLAEEVIQKAFTRFGTIQEIRVFKDKGYAFIKFTSKEAATNAIVYMHNQEILGQTVKCSWGKETIDSTMPTANPLAQGLSTPFIYSYSQQLPYWYQAYSPGLQATAPGQSSYTVQAAAASMQYPYNQYYPAGSTVSTNQSNAFANSLAGPAAMPITAWTHQATGQHQQLSNNNNTLGASHHLSVPIHQPTAMQQPLMSTYTMQGYQAQ